MFCFSVNWVECTFIMKAEVEANQIRRHIKTKTTVTLIRLRQLFNAKSFFTTLTTFLSYLLTQTKLKKWQWQCQIILFFKVNLNTQIVNCRFHQNILVLSCLLFGEVKRKQSCLVSFRNCLYRHQMAEKKLIWMIVALKEMRKKCWVTEWRNRSKDLIHFFFVFVLSSISFRFRCLNNSSRHQDWSRHNRE